MIALPRIAAVAGALLGAALALALPRAGFCPKRSPPTAGPLVDDAEGPIARVAFQFDPEAEALVAPTLGPFLATLDPTVRLEAAGGSALSARVVALDFDAGDLAVTEGRVLADPELLQKNAGRGLGDKERLAAELSRLFHAPATVLGARAGDLPRHHLSMYLAPLGGGAVLLGDPRWGRALVGEGYAPGATSPETGQPLTADFSRTTLSRYDRAARALEEAGFRVVRIPTVPFDEKTYFAYTNAVLETRGGHRVAWVPLFDEPRLDAAARAVWAAQGFELRPVPYRRLFPYHGTIGCLVTVLARGPVR